MRRRGARRRDARRARAVHGQQPGGTLRPAQRFGAQVALGFPGVGGTMRDDVVTYFTIAQQPTAIEASDSPRLAAIADTLTSRGLPVQRIPIWMAGWPITQCSSPRCLPGCPLWDRPDATRRRPGDADAHMRRHHRGLPSLALRSRPRPPTQPRRAAHRWLAPIAIRSFPL